VSHSANSPHLIATKCRRSASLFLPSSPSPLPSRAFLYTRPVLNLFQMQGRFDAAISKVCFELLLETFNRILARDLGEKVEEAKGDGKLVC
jgi:hypothetical protein